jgi:hypothetical protein
MLSSQKVLSLMPTLATLTDSEVRTVLGKRTYNKAAGYVNRIRNPQRRGDTLSAQIQGTYLYNVEVDVVGSAILGKCTCAYSWGGHCKHIGALLICWAHSPTRFQEDTSTADATFLPPPPTQTPKVHPSWLSQSWSERDLHWRTVLKNYFNAQTLPALRAIAQERGWNVRGVRKDDVVDQLLERIMDRAETAKGIYSLDQEHQAVLRALTLVGDLADNTPVLANQMARGEKPLKQHVKIDTYTRHLCEQGLAIPAAQMQSYPQRDFIPWVLARTFPPVLETMIPSSLAPESEQAASALAFANPEAGLRSMLQLLMFFEQQKLPLRPLQPIHRLEKFHSLRLTGWPYVAAELDKALQRSDLNQYNSSLTLTVPPPALPLPDAEMAQLTPITGDVERLDFLYALLQASGLVQPGSPVTPWNEAKAAFLIKSDAEQLAILAKSYFHMENWSELWLLLRREPRLQLKRSWWNAYFRFDQLMAEFTTRRLLILRTLALLPDNRWIKLADLQRIWRALWPQFQGASRSSYGGEPIADWFLTWDGSKIVENEESWTRAQGSFIQAMLIGPLHWLGLVDLNQHDGQVVALRLHGLADLFWDRSATLSISASGIETLKESPPAKASAAPRASDLRPSAVKLDDDGRLLVDPQRISARAHGLLDRIAKMDFAVTGRFVYRLDGESVHRSFEAGVSLAQLEMMWNELLKAPMPTPIQSQLSQWWDAYGRTRIYTNVSLIELGDDYALAEMKSVTSLSSLMIAELSPRLVLIPKDAIPKLVSELEAAGYTPKQVLS